MAVSAEGVTLPPGVSKSAHKVAGETRTTRQASRAKEDLAIIGTPWMQDFERAHIRDERIYHDGEDCTLEPHVSPAFFPAPANFSRPATDANIAGPWRCRSDR